MTNHISELIAKVSQLGKEYNSIEEIKLFGSQRIRLSSNADLDLLIITNDDAEKDLLLKSLCSLSLSHRILIHPIVLNESEFRIRKQYDLFQNNILKKSIVLFTRFAN